jgi:hypothetical protein
MRDHDELFKELLTEFFFEFMDLFFPNIASQLDRTFVEQLDKEVSSVSGSGRKQRADLVRKVWNKTSKGFIVIHIEIQSTAQLKFQERMYRYYYAIEEKYRLPVLPIAILTFQNPKQEQASSFHGFCAGKRIVDFEFCLIQLNQYNWRSFIAKDTPAASALMACMLYDNQERPEVKLECLRQLVRCKLEKERELIIQKFIDAYLQLNNDEKAIFNRKLADTNALEDQKIMGYITSWQKEGMEIGRAEGLAEGLTKGLVEGRSEGRTEASCKIVLKVLTRLHGTLPADLSDEIKSLSEEKLNRLSDDFFDLKTIQDLITWLQTH